MSELNVGDHVEVKEITVGIANSVQPSDKGKITKTEPYWFFIEWDEPKEGRVNGWYVNSLFKLAEPEAVDLTAAIAALVDQTTEEAYQRGLEDGQKTAKVISDTEKAELRAQFEKLNKVSNLVHSHLVALKVL